MFSNAKNIEINGKEIKSISLENGGLLYEKPSSMGLTITSNKDILSYYDNDTATLTTTILQNGVPQQDEQIIFSSDKGFVSQETLNESDYDNGIKYFDFNDNFILERISTQDKETDLSFRASGSNAVQCIIYSTNKPLLEEDPITGQPTIVGQFLTSITINRNGVKTRYYGKNSEIKYQNKKLLFVNAKTDENEEIDISWIEEFLMSCYITMIDDEEASIKYYSKCINTDNNGEATLIYDSQGIGDVTISAECMNLQETYVLEDCVKYDSNTYSNKSQMTYSVSLPSAFECSFVIKPLARSNANSVLYATDGSNDILIGQYNSSGTNNGIWCGGSAHNTDTTTTLNTELTFIWRYENGVHTVSWDDHTVTTNCPQPTSLTKLTADSNNSLKNIKIKPIDTPIINNIVLTSDKSVLSAYDSDTCILTATVSGNNVDGLTVEFFNGTASLGTSVITNGVATKTYSATGAGNVTITAKCMNIQETYELIDAKYYASNETINLAPKYNNDRNLFASDYQIQEGDKIHFRFKNITNHMLWGIGSTAGSDFSFEQVGTKLYYWRNVLSNSSYNNPSFLATTENDYIFEYLKYDSTQWKVNIYIGDRYIDYWRCGSSIRKIRIDKYDDSNPSWDIEVFVL